MQLGAPDLRSVECKVFIDLPAIVHIVCFPVLKGKQRTSKRLEPAQYKERQKKRNQCFPLLFKTPLATLREEHFLVEKAFASRPQALILSRSQIKQFIAHKNVVTTAAFTSDE